MGFAYFHRVSNTYADTSRPRLALTLFVTILVLVSYLQFHFISPHANAPPAHASSTLARCLSLDAQPGPEPDYHFKRHVSDRFDPDSRPILIQNARIWTGKLNGTQTIQDGSVLLDQGLIKAVHSGQIPRKKIRKLLGKHRYHELEYVDAKGRWVTPGIVDMHSHMGDNASPELEGAALDFHSTKGPVLPYLRSLDGLNTHDESYRLSIAGGVTSALVLPGSGNAIGGQGFAIKLRRTKERSPTSMLLEPPFEVVSPSASHERKSDTELRPPHHKPPPPPHPQHRRWRHMKHACGENPGSQYSGSRMDTMWAFRQAYEKGRQIKTAQDAYCAKALNGEWRALGDAEFPELDLQWEALVAVLRGHVKVHTHCYEAVDLDDFVRLSNEFGFPVAAFHHAHETYLVPEVLKRAYKHPPAVALFATNARYKREAYRGSEFAARILTENGIKVVMKSDHPVLNSRYLLYEAQQAFYYGLPENVALTAVTSTPAEIMGLDHRIGYVKEGWDADLIIWDSHLLALGATPTQVFIDGIPQLHHPQVVHKPSNFQDTPRVPDFDEEAHDAFKYDGLPPLEPKKAEAGAVIFVNVKNVFIRDGKAVTESFAAQEADAGVVLVKDGKIVCFGVKEACLNSDLVNDAKVVDLHNGSIFPGLTSFGSPLGLMEIDAEISTNDGYVYDPLSNTVPKVLGKPATLVRAVDGLQFATRDALLAYRSGVTKGITAPQHGSFYSGLSTFFSLGASHKLERGALIQDVAALHVSIRHFDEAPSISTQIATLRRLLLDPPSGEAGKWFRKVTDGIIPLVVEAHSADVIATLILLKKEVEAQTEKDIKFTITGASEAHLLAKQIGEAGIGVVVSPARPFPAVWESRRILPGPPLTEKSAISTLIANNVTVGIGIQEKWDARNLAFDVAWTSLEAGGEITKSEALALGSTNLEKLLGGDVEVAEAADLVVAEGGDIFEMGHKVIGAIDGRAGLVHLF